MSVDSSKEKTNMHTPGPWRVGERNGGGIDIRSDNGYLLAKASTPSPNSRGKEWSEDNAYCEGNAKLIAAAPELLYALSAVVNEFPTRTGGQTEAVTAALAAIKKATT